MKKQTLLLLILISAMNLPITVLANHEYDRHTVGACDQWQDRILESSQSDHFIYERSQESDLVSWHPLQMTYYVKEEGWKQETPNAGSDIISAESADSRYSVSITRQRSSYSTFLTYFFVEVRDRKTGKSSGKLDADSDCSIGTP